MLIHTNSNHIEHFWEFQVVHEALTTLSTEWQRVVCNSREMDSYAYAYNALGNKAHKLCINNEAFAGVSG